MDNALRFEFKVGLKELKHQRPKRKEAEIKKEPRLRQTLILAYHIQDIINESKAKDFTQIAKWLNMTKARLSQIMNFVNLAPSIQEEILVSKNNKINELTEYKIHDITTEVDWKKQNKLWKELTS
ncbi:MAG: hypothetical protein ISS47_02580 [Candidatus Omnitrophica bacterium]|nr:hypothetical protein [Candidatus Omnitrophota bacterium]